MAHARMVRLALALAVLGLAAGSANAGIIGWTLAAADGALTTNSTAWQEDPETYVMIYDGAQHYAPGHLSGDMTSDTETDPNVWFTNTVENDTTFDWTGFTFNIYLNKSFSILSASAPSGWSSAITQPTLSGGGQYLGHVDYTGGSPILVGDEATFGAKISFVGSVQFAQELIPVPEPAAAAVLMLSGVALAARRWARRRGQNFNKKSAFPA